jgi:hypothetical protein
MTITITFNKLTVQATHLEEVYIKAAMFRKHYGFELIRWGGDIRWDLIPHDYLHWVLNVYPSNKGEALLLEVEEYLQVDPEYKALLSSDALWVYERLYRLGIK